MNPSPLEYCKDRTVHISTIAEALIALETEINKLDHDAALMHKRLALITAKQRICTDTLKAFLAKINLVSTPESSYIKIKEYT